MPRSSGWTSILFVSLLTCLEFMESLPGVAAERGFPYEQELLLDARPMRGSKRIPMMEVRRRGDTKIDLWCNSVPAQFVIVEDTITIITGAKSNEPCAADRARSDDELLATLA